MRFDRFRSWISAGLAACLLCFSARPAFAGTTGSISGRVLDQNQKPVAAATIVLAGTKLGAYSDADGHYRVAKVPPGSYEVSVSRLNYESVRVREVIVSADQNTTLELQVRETTLAAEEVVVVAKRPPVDLKQTSTQATVTREEIQTLPVQELQDVVNLQAGVVDGHFRGGRTGEVQYQVDGISVNNPFDNQSSVSVDRSLLQEVQVISGTFDAEYGQSMSGVVNAVLKSGTEKFEWGAEAFTGAFVFDGGARRDIDDDVDPLDIQNYQAHASGPLPLPSTLFLASGRRYVSDSYLRGERTFMPSDSSDFERAIFRPTGDGEVVALGVASEWSGLAKVTNTSIPGAKVGYQVLFDYATGRNANPQFRLNPEGALEYNYVAVVHGADWTHTLNPETFVDVSLRHNYAKTAVYRYEDLYDPRYDEAGPLVGDSEYELGAFVQGVDFYRFRARTNGYLMKASLVSQLTREHQMKAGFEIHRHEVGFGAPGHLVFTTSDGVEQLIRKVDEPPDFPGFRKYRPFIGGAFIQDQAEWPALTLRAGVRVDYFDPRSTIPSDLSNPANSIEGAPESELVSTSRKVSFSPRLGVAYPIEDYAALHFAYGHFRQFPPIGTIFQNADYSILETLQAGRTDYGVLGNPDVEPEETVQYEFGYKHALNDDFGVDLTTFYKDVRNLLGVEFVSTYNDAEYARLTNVDFGDVFGITLSADHRALGPVKLAVDYTWQHAMGNSSDPRETATRAAAGQDPRPRLIPLNWDQRHAFNLTASLDRNAYSASVVLRIASGQPYTPILETGFGQSLDTNSGRKPSSALLDLRTERALGTWSGQDVRVFARAFNVLDTRYFNGPVFPSTGDPYYSRFPTTDEVALADPTRFYPPRRLEIGVRFGTGGL